MNKSLSDNNAIALEMIKNHYMLLHPKTHEIDMKMAEEFLVRGTSVKELAYKYNYHENTVYNKISMVQAFIETFYDYEYVSLPNSLFISLSNLNTYSYKLMLMAMSKYQCFGICVINRKDIVSRFPYLSHNRHMQRIVSELKGSSALYAPSDKDFIAHLTPNIAEPIPVFESVQYSKSKLTYKFSESLDLLLQIGKYLHAPTV